MIWSAKVLKEPSGSRRSAVRMRSNTPLGQVPSDLCLLATRWRCWRGMSFENFFLTCYRSIFDFRIGEKFLDWTDTDPPLDTILEAVTLYWVTETFPRSIYPYRRVSLVVGFLYSDLLTSSL
jgi:hypothetical protein